MGRLKLEVHQYQTYVMDQGDKADILFLQSARQHRCQELQMMALLAERSSYQIADAESTGLLKPDFVR